MDRRRKAGGVDPDRTERDGKGFAPTESGGPPTSSSTPRLESGEILAGRYRIGKLLGRGGMGAVFEAEDRELGIEVALKTLLPEAALDETALRGLKREVLLARQVSHRNVCRLHDLGRDEDRGLLFATMELLRGETLAARIQRLGRLSAEEALPLVAQMVEGLEAAHGAGVVHRDFKSANVMLAGGNGGTRVALADFGLARPVLREEVSVERSRVEGTPAYMAPEQMRGEGAGPRADLYALGVVLFETVTGRLPFEGEDAWGGSLRKLEEEAPSVRRFVPELPEAWENGIARCLARHPEDRFERTGELLAVLRGTAETATRRRKGNLPAARDSFHGRREEIEQIGRRFEEGTRLVTLTGTAGAGKTRLSQEFGRASEEEWSGGVWFCDLSEATGRDGVASAVATALGVPLGRVDPVVQLGHAIEGRGRCLLILDNTEQVAGPAGEAVEAWCGRTTRAAFLVTSRERLGVEEEEPIPIEALDHEQAVELFLERARRHRPGFDPDAKEREEIERLVRGLEGLPLAVELAAARVRMMTPGQIADRLSDRFRLLSDGRGSGRHRALRAAIDTSWELLEEWERAAIAQTSVFEGGFTLEAAEEVLDLSEFPEAPWTVDVVQALLDRSLLRLLPTGAGEPRFGMYVSLQEYAAEKLDEKSARAAEERHVRHYARFGTDEAIEALARHGGVELRRQLSLELDNLVAACRRAVEREDGAAAVASFRGAATVLQLEGPFAVAVELGRAVAGMEGLGPSERLRAELTLGSYLWFSGQMKEAGVYYERALARARALGDRGSEGVVLGNLGILHRERGRIEEAGEHYGQALAIHREVGNRRFEGQVLGNLGVLHYQQGRTEEAWEYYERALALAHEVGDRRSEGVVLGNLGILHQEQGRMEEAGEHYEQALAIHREVGNRPSEGHVLGHLGNLHKDQGRMEEASEHYKRAHRLHRELGDRRYEGAVLGNLGILYQEQGRMEEAREHYECALAILREASHRRFEGVVLGRMGNLHKDQGRMKEAREHYERALAIHREAGDRRSVGVVLGNLGDLEAREGREEEAHAAFTEGAGLLRKVGDRFELGRFLCKRGEAEIGWGDAAAAIAVLEEAASLAETVGAGPDSELGKAVARLRVRVDADVDGDPS